MTNAAALADTIAANVISSGATLDLNFNGTLAPAHTFTVSGTGVGGNGAITFSNGTGSTLSGGITLGANTTFGGAGIGTISGAIADGLSSFSVTKLGAGTLTLTNTNTFDGGFSLSGGVLKVSRMPI